MEVTDPSGSKRRIDAFAWKTLHAASSQSVKCWNPSAPWNGAFATLEGGSHHYAVFAQDRLGSVTDGPQGSLTPASDHPGYIHRAPQKPRYLSYDNGSPYWPVGHNICQPVTQQPYRYDFAVPPDQKTYSYDRFLARMGQADMTWGRIWMTPWNLGLEGPADWHQYHGFGDYNLANAWRMDHVLATARSQGVHLNLTVMHKSEVPRGRRKARHQSQWNSCVYNVANGGPLERGSDFFTHPAILKAFKNRLRYMVARWGWDTTVCAWELFGETNLMRL